jgi:hypothetical protein
MVGDAEDRARWARYRVLLERARGLERLSRMARDVDDALRLRDDAQSLRRQAHRLTV